MRSFLKVFITHFSFKPEPKPEPQPKSEPKPEPEPESEPERERGEVAPRSNDESGGRLDVIA